jgi:protocatechuate 3,4-dioxygenase beta subunit
MRNARSLRTLLSSLSLAGLVGASVSASLAAVQGPTPAPREARPMQVQPPRDPNAPGAPVVVGKGSISGTVSVAGSGQPARRARVNLSGGSEVGGGRNTTTDDMGRFAFSALPEGRFNLSASKPGHIAGSYGQRQPGRPGTPIQLADGQRLQVQLQITKGGVITGTVLDENAEALPGTPVRALRYVMQSGVRTLVSAGNGATDDRGVYRIYGLQPGEYIVFATPRNANNQGLESRQVELQQLVQQSEVMARMEAVEARAAQALAERITQLRASIPAPVGGDDAVTGYAPVYYPGTTAASSAATVAVGPGEEKGSIDFQYQVVPIARIDGIVASAATATQVPSNIQVSLVNTGFAVPGISPGSARADAQGAFRISNVPPGQYTLIARATIGGAGREGAPPGREGGPGGRGPITGGRGEFLAGRGRAVGPAGADQIRLWATADVTVDGRNVSNVVLTLQPGMSVSGRIAFEGAAQPPADLTRLRIQFMPVATPGAPGEISNAAPGRVDADGRFTISSVVPGRYRLTASGAGTGWFLGSATIEGQDSLDFPVEVKPNHNINGAVVTFDDRQSELTGTIVNERAQPVPDYTLIVYPADQRFWTPQSRRIQSARPATDGRYSFRNLPAGDYRLVPVYDPEPGSWFDPAFLQQLETASVRVSIADGEKKEQHLRVPGGG